MIRRTLFVALVLVYPFMFAASQDYAIGMPPNLSDSVLKKLINTPTVINAWDTETGRDGQDKLWFKLFSDIHMVSDVPIDRLYVILNDFENYPNIFDGSNKITILRTTPEGIIVHADAGMLGVTVEYAYLQTEPVKSANECLLVRTDVPHEGNGTTRAMYTQYYLRTITIDGKQYTYIRNRDETEYMSQVPGQYPFMKLNNVRTHKNGLKDLIAAARKN